MTADAAGWTVTADAAGARRIAASAEGRVLAIDYFASRCCSSLLVGDLETRWVESGSHPEFVDVGNVAGTPVVADRRLVSVLATGRATIVETGGLLGKSIGVRLGKPEVWIAFLDSPAARGERGGRTVRRSPA